MGNFLQKIFSIRNIENRKVVTVLGLKIKFKKKVDNTQYQIYQLTKKVDALNSLQQKQFKQLNSVLLMSHYPGLTVKDAARKMYENYPKATGFLADVQACNLKLMKELKALCDELDIKFWLHAGTLIGQLRHEGFIPWDDDVDLAMTRNDFNILKDNLETNERLQLCEYYNELTCSRQYQLKYRNADIPVFIDIVVYDECDATTPEQIVAFREKFANVKKEMLEIFRTKLKSPKIIDIGYYKVGLFDEKTKKQVDELIDTQSEKLKPATPIENPTYFYGLQNYPFAYPVMLNRDLFPLQLVKYEDTLFYIPFNSFEYLKGYGDIFLPPTDIDDNKHVYAFIDKKDKIAEFLSGENNE